MISRPWIATPADPTGDQPVKLTLEFVISSRQLTEVRAMTAAELRLFPESEPEPDSGGCTSDYISAVHRPALKPHRPVSPEEEARRALESLAEPEPDRFPSLAETEREQAKSLSLAAYYRQHVDRWRQAQIGSKRIKASTARAERTHVNAWESWDLAVLPPGWPEDIPWAGCPLSHLTERRLREFLMSAVESGNAGTRKGEPWSVASANSCWRSLRAVLALARKHLLIERIPELPSLKKQLTDLVPIEDAEDAATPYSDEELGKLYAVIPAVVEGSTETIHWPQTKAKRAAQQQAVIREIRALIVLLANCGARVGDWVEFEFGRQLRLDTREAYWRSNKRSKVHRVPLADVTIAHLERLRRSHARLPGIKEIAFPNLVTQRAKNRATKILKLAVVAIGLDLGKYPKPWHSIRRSCTTRFNAHGVAIGVGSVGKLITHGKDADVASQSYDNPQPLIAKAVATIGWPPEFAI